MSRTESLNILGVGHLGIRVADLARSLHFYEHLGFTKVAGPFEGDPVVILKNPAGVEINLIVNAIPTSSSNVLMDIPERHPGFTHVALLVADLEQTQARLAALGIELSGGPVSFPNGAKAVFVRDPDRNVIELHQPKATP